MKQVLIGLAILFTMQANAQCDSAKPKSAMAYIKQKELTDPNMGAVKKQKLKPIQVEKKPLSRKKKVN